MTAAEHVYETYIAATPAEVWTAVTDSDWTERYFHRTRFEGPLVEGSTYRTHLADGDPAVDGVVEQLHPPQDGEPGRFVVTWHILYDDVLAAEHPGRVEWTISGVADGLTLVRLVHGDLADSPLTSDHVEHGWVWVLDALKTVLETGRSLPAPAREVSR